MISRRYGNFRGVDFANNEVLLSRSPYSKNMWKNNGVLETRPGMTLKAEFGLQLFGLFFYDITSGGTTTTHVLFHVGTKLYKWNNYPNTPNMSGADVTELYSGLNPRESYGFVWNNIFFFKDGINYLEYNGSTIAAVVGTIPLTSTGRTPAGATTDSTTYQDVNLLQAKRKNGFVGDGTSKDYYLDTTNIDAAALSVTVNGIAKIETTDFTVNRTNGIVSFITAPSVPSTDGTSNVFITYSKTVSGYEDRIKKCTLAVEFDHRMFFSGNQDYPNTLFHSELDDPRYIRDTAYYTEGLNLAPIKALVPGNDCLWVFKWENQANTTVFCHTPTLDYTYGKIYPSTHSNIATGCIATGINFNDDIVFVSKNGLEAISGDINSEKLLAHRSSLVDPKMTVETNYENMKLVEHKGYLFCLVNGKIYLADSRQVFTNELTGEMEYEWYYFELPNTITYIKDINGTLYLGNASGKLYTLSGTTDNGTAISSVWTTPKDNFGSDSIMKTTNKKGGVADVKVAGSITVKAISDATTQTIGTYTTEKGYIVYKIKTKKWKNIQLEFSGSNIGINAISLEAFAGAYIKE